MNTSQIQLKLSLSHQLNDLLEAKAARLGVPVTQFVKHLILKEVDEEEYPTFKASKRTEEAYARAMKDKKNAIPVTNITEFFKNL